MSRQPDRETAEERFRVVFSHLGSVAAYARRRGSGDPDAIAAEAMTIAWRRLVDVPVDDSLPWLYATARNLVLAETRNSARPTVGREEAAAAKEPFELDRPFLPTSGSRDPWWGVGRPTAGRWSCWPWRSR